MVNQELSGYRKDIQVLRGIAIILVLGYHLRIPGFENGFFGVDIFFVISGFLMARIYTSGEISTFYMRRARRLLPAYFLTILITIVISFLLAVPSDLRQVVDQAKYSVALIPNLFFWSQDSYFLTSTHSPLLHLWSLGVEFQFYLVFPVLFYLYEKNRRVVYSIFAISLVSCLVMVSLSPKTSFFLLPFRIWEFMLGMFALGLTRRNYLLKNSLHKGIIRAGITVVLAAALFIYPTNGLSTSIILGHPGIASVMVSIVSVLYLIYSPNLSGWRWLETIGKYSYSIYLVHFPIISLSQYKAFAGTNLSLQPTLKIFVILVVIISLAKFMYNLVEVPFRAKRLPLKSWLVCTILMLICISNIPNLKAQQLTKEENRIVEARFDRSEYRCGKLSRVFNPRSKVCVVGSNTFGKRILLLGNSHADAIKTSFSIESNLNQKTMFFWVQNDPLMYNSSDLSAIMSEIESKKSSEVYLHYSYNSVNHETLLNFFSLLQAKRIEVTILGPIPTWANSVPEQLWLSRNIGADSITLDQNFAEFSRRNSADLTFYKGSLPEGVKFYDLGRYLCTPICSYRNEKGFLLYWDSEHLTLTGGKALSSVFRQATGP